MNIASKIRLPEGLKVTKSRKYYDKIRPNESQFDGGLGALAEGQKVTKLETGFYITRPNKMEV